MRRTTKTWMARGIEVSASVVAVLLAIAHAFERSPLLFAAVFLATFTVYVSGHRRPGALRTEGPRS